MLTTKGNLRLTGAQYPRARCDVHVRSSLWSSVILGSPGYALRHPGAPTLLDEEYTVSAVCDICAKKPGFGHNVSHSHRRTKRRFNPNIQRVRTVVNGAPKRVNVCTSCLKAGKVSR